MRESNHSVHLWDVKRGHFDEAGRLFPRKQIVRILLAGRGQRETAEVKKGLKSGDNDSQPLQVKVGGVTRYHTVGYSTVYEYYAYGREVNKKRPRIAQMVLNELKIQCVGFLGGWRCEVLMLIYRPVRAAPLPTDGSRRQASQLHLLSLQGRLHCCRHHR